MKHSGRSMARPYGNRSMMHDGTWPVGEARIVSRGQQKRMPRVVNGTSRMDRLVGGGTDCQVSLKFDKMIVSNDTV